MGAPIQEQENPPLLNTPRRKEPSSSQSPPRSMTPGCPPSLPHRRLRILVQFGQSYRSLSQRTLSSKQTSWKPKKGVPAAAFEHARRIWLIRLSGRIRTFHGGLGRRGAYGKRS